jgi:diphthamide biosynthesis enzyme Dph1/Dph2-like protein
MAEIMFIETRKIIDKSDIDFKKLEKFPEGNVSLAASVQYLGMLPFIEDFFIKQGRKVFIKQGAYYDGHVIGCQPQAFDLSADNFLLLCDGRFHALNNALIIDKEIYVFDGNDLSFISKKDLNEYYDKIKLKKNKFLINEKIGLLVSDKHGQKSLSFEKVRKNIEKLGKKVYVFECNDVDINEFENFPNIRIFVNTACFGLGLDDNRIINLADIVEFFK